ncbi:MAG: Uma2 family endonuclease [Planctomycetaceae bacterium]|nr:Uma2 family endonuclease [Planctomycetaceae bacterium]
MNLEVCKSSPTRWLTAEEFFLLPSNGQRAELVRGESVPCEISGFRHGALCCGLLRAVTNYLVFHDIARVVPRVGIITHRNPDTVRGPEVSVLSYDRLPRTSCPIGYLDVPPEAVFEVLDPTDRPENVLDRVAEFLAASVLYVIVVDPDRETVVVHRADRSQSLLLKGQSLTLPELLPGFELPLDRLFPGQ